jgi:hypothetical protein
MREQHVVANCDQFSRCFAGLRSNLSFSCRINPLPPLHGGD